MQTLLRKSGYVFHTSAEKEVVRMIKEKTGYIALDPVKEEKEWSGSSARSDGKSVEYTLPDGNKLKVGNSNTKMRAGVNFWIRLVLSVFEPQRSCSIQS